MAKSLYASANGLARKVKKMYLGIEGVARKVKKGYIGINGIARLFFAGGAPVYAGETTPLSAARTQLSVASTKSYALFAGGVLSSNKTTNLIDSYDEALTLASLPFGLNYSNAQMSRTQLGEKAFFAGGYSGNYNAYISVFNDDLTQEGDDAALSWARLPAPGSTAQYAIFIGGRGRTQSQVNRPDSEQFIDAFDDNLTHVEGKALENDARQGNQLGESLGLKVITSGGIVVNDDLTENTVTSIPIYSNTADNSASCVTTGNHVIFCGARSHNETYAYDQDLTMIEGPTGPHNKSFAASWSFDGRGFVFGGGNTSGSSGYNDVWVFDEDLTLDNSITSADPGLTLGAAAQAGDKIIFAGGMGEGYYGDESSDRAEVIAFE